MTGLPLTMFSLQAGCAGALAWVRGRELPEESAHEETAAPSEVQLGRTMATAPRDNFAGLRVEYASARKLRVRNKLYYRVFHWPIWITVFYLAPGPMTFNLFAHGFDRSMGAWLGLVIVGTGIAGLRGKLPGVEPAPYILRFTEDRPNPLYRRVCYTVAWGELVAYTVLNVVGLVDAIVGGVWHLKQIYYAGYLPLAGFVWLLGAMGKMPRVKASTAGEGDERRYFYAMVWAVPTAECVLWAMWGALPRGRWEDVVRLLAFVGTLAVIWAMSARGILPRTRKIVPGELAVCD